MATGTRTSHADPGSGPAAQPDRAVTTTALLSGLARLQQRVYNLVAGMDDPRCRRQYHPELSPLGWHLGHCAFIEIHWLHRAFPGMPAADQWMERLFNPAITPKTARGEQLPDIDRLLHWVSTTQQRSLCFLEEQPSGVSDKPLNSRYLQWFLLQHYCQHYETMMMVLQQKALSENGIDHRPVAALAATDHEPRWRSMPAGRYAIGGDAPLAYDNELPAHEIQLDAFRIAASPVSNAQYLGFMESGGYQRRSLWDDEGWQWLGRHDRRHPEHWRRDDGGDWFAIQVDGPALLRADEAVSGIGYFEARAFARWAGARLPHEYQWEAARRAGLLENPGNAWEWCENAFHPYDGFRAFPYDEYSLPWFDGRHRTLKGGSRYTQAPIRRASFRNFYTPAQRHIFAGLRLVTGQG